MGQRGMTNALMNFGEGAFRPVVAREPSVTSWDSHTAGSHICST
jgi:hypothetical protein